MFVGLPPTCLQIRPLPLLSVRRLDLPPPRRLSPRSDSRGIMGQLAAETSTASGRAALWSWNASEGVLTIRAEPGSPLASLDGRWTFQSLLEQFDGLARVRI